MFCTQCGRRLEESERYCPNCHSEVKRANRNMPNNKMPETSKEKTNPWMKKISNFAVSGVSRLDHFVDQKIEGSIRERKHREKCETHATVPLQLLFGYKQLGVNPVTVLRQRKDGYVYFDYLDHVLYQLVSYEWEGSEFATVSNSSSKGNTQYKERSRTGGHRMGMMAGAAIGTAIAPGLGTAVGTAVGAGGARRTKTRGTAIEETNEVSRIEEVEKDTQAQLILQNIDTGETHRLLFICNRQIDGMIRCLTWPQPEKDDVTHLEEGENEPAPAALEKQELPSPSGQGMLDYTQQLFQLKSLLDAGILTQEEFEEKKKQILSLL